MSEFQGLVVFVGVCVEISNDDALETFLFGCFDVILDKSDEVFPFCYVVASLVSVYVNDFELLSW